ncbi:aminotransferase class IV [Paenibacillus sp. GCM10027627]|uniref:aminotransferase class IV n=1 Tax=unclassified Paenibacillus TaxID=185978 RepID=UPI003632BFA0
MKVGLRGNIVPANEAVISVFDHGFLYGLGLFETFRTYGGRPYLLDRHMDRLKRGCAELGIRFDTPIEVLEQWTRELLAANGLEDGYVRLTVSAGEAALGLPSGDYEEPNVLLLVKELPSAGGGAVPAGKQLCLLRTRRNTPEGTVRFKSLHYMNNILAKRELTGYSKERSEGPAVQAGAEGLMLSEAGWLAEGIVSNLFFASGGVVHTPAVGTGILPGITRQRLLELAVETGYEAEEGYYRWEELLAADEVWMTNSIQELVPVTKLTDPSGSSVVVGSGEAGALTMILLEKYRQDTRRVCGLE